MNYLSKFFMAAVATVLVTTLALAQPRDTINIVGSSTVFPYTQAVAEQFSNMTGAPSPVVESTGTGGGMQIFCGGIGGSYPDITGASRAIKQSELELCRENGVDDVTEVRIGNDGLSLSVSRDNDFTWDLTLTEIYQALAAELMVDGEMVPNTNQVWSDVNSQLPKTEILVYGPPPTSGTRDAFVELAMVAGCMEIESIESQGEDWAEEHCARMRTDGAFVEAGENDNLIVQRLKNDPDAMGIFGYSFLYENLDVLKPVMVQGVEPETDTIASGDYPISRPLFFYVKNDHRGAIPNLQAFVEEYVSEASMGPGGYLSSRGLVPLSGDAREQVRDAAINAKNMME